MISALSLLVLGQFIPGTRLGTPAESLPPRSLVWSTADVLGKGVDRTLVATGTKAGQRYQFHAVGVCKWEGTPILIFNENGPPTPIATGCPPPARNMYAPVPKSMTATNNPTIAYSTRFAGPWFVSVLIVVSWVTERGGRTVTWRRHAREIEVSLWDDEPE